MWGTGAEAAAIFLHEGDIDSDKTNGLSKQMRKNSSCVPWKEDPSSIKGRFI